jgi:Ca2+-binding EF-hand superfamily protein
MQGKTMRINRLALLTLTALSLSGAAFSGAAFADAGQGPLKAADTNKDGVVDQAEFQASRDQWFQKLDTNKDGFISTDELKAAAEQMHAAWAQKHPDSQQNTTQQSATGGTRTDRFAQGMLKRVDTDHDGKISQAEFNVESANVFKRMDKNGDGKLASDEMHGWRGGHPGGHFFLARMDQNHDGEITKAEFTAASDAMFQKLDKNGDGVISKDEMHMSKPGADKTQSN